MTKKENKNNKATESVSNDAKAKQDAADSNNSSAKSSMRDSSPKNGGKKGENVKLIRLKESEIIHPIGFHSASGKSPKKGNVTLPTIDSSPKTSADQQGPTPYQSDPLRSPKKATKTETQPEEDKIHTDMLPPPKPLKPATLVYLEKWAPRPSPKAGQSPKHAAFHMNSPKSGNAPAKQAAPQIGTH